MIGLDSNVLVRLFVQDEPGQAARADLVLGSLSPDQPGWIGIAVLVETIWVLTSRYRITRDEVLSVVTNLLSRKELILEQAQIVHQAVTMYRTGKAGFADCLIACSAKAVGCHLTYTFDEDAVKSAGMTLVP